MRTSPACSCSEARLLQLEQVAGSCWAACQRVLGRCQVLLGLSNRLLWGCRAVIWSSIELR